MEIEQRIDGLLTVPPYSLEPQQRQDTVAGIAEGRTRVRLRDEIPGFATM